MNGSLEPDILRRGKAFHRQVQEFYARKHGGEQILNEHTAAMGLNWAHERTTSARELPAFRKNVSGKKGRYDILILLDSTDPNINSPEDSPPVAFYSLLEIKSTEFDGRALRNVRRIISRHCKQLVGYIGTLVDFSTPEFTGYPESTVAPGIIYPTAPQDKLLRDYIEAFFDEDCIAVVWFNEIPNDTSPNQA